MVLTCSVIFCFFLRLISCGLQCIPETLDDTEFHLNVPEHIKVESIDCIVIPHNVTFPQSKVTFPYIKKLFNGDPSNVVDAKEVSHMDFDTIDEFSINELPRGEYEFGIKLEWGCNQTYVYPKRIHISVSALTRKPTFWSSPMMENQRTFLTCLPAPSCSRGVFLSWKWSNAMGQTTILDDDYMDYEGLLWYRCRYRERFRLHLYPTADHHNTNITCVAKYDYDTVETTITLTVKFSPRILNDSYCAVKEALLVCVCISWGNPLPPIIWPSETFTDFSVTSFSDAQKVKSTLTMPAAKYQNDTVRCISRNDLGQAETTLLIKNSAEDIGQKGSVKGFYSALPWITGVSFTLNLFFSAVIIYVIKRSRTKHKEQLEEANTYASLRKAEIGEEYSVISCRTK